MPPKDAKADKARAQAAAKKIEDKTFGMKNKNKCVASRCLYAVYTALTLRALCVRRSKQVQNQIAQMKQAYGINRDDVRLPSYRTPCTPHNAHRFILTRAMRSPMMIERRRRRTTRSTRCSSRKR